MKIEITEQPVNMTHAEIAELLRERARVVDDAMTTHLLIAGANCIDTNEKQDRMVWVLVKMLDDARKGNTLLAMGAIALWPTMAQIGHVLADAWLYVLLADIATLVAAHRINNLLYGWLRPRYQRQYDERKSKAQPKPEPEVANRKGASNDA